MLYGGDAFGIVAALDDGIERRLAARARRAGPTRSSRSARWRAWLMRGHARWNAAEGSVASASISNCGCSPRTRSRVKLTGIATTKVTLPRSSSSAGFGGRVRGAYDVEIVGIPQRRHDRAGEGAADRRCRIAVGQVLGIEIDGIAEQQKLHHRQRHHHGEGGAVAPHLDEFLDQHAIEAAPRKSASSSRRLAAPGLPGDG